MIYPIPEPEMYSWAINRQPTNARLDLGEDRLQH